MNDSGPESVGHDVDIQALKQAVAALKLSSSRRMLKANLEFLLDYFMHRPSAQLPEHLQPEQRKPI